MPRHFAIVDLFAGPGGLGEGFTAAGRESGPSMDIVLSVEKEAIEVQTLRQRAFLRRFPGGFPDEYYAALNSGSELPDWRSLYPAAWKVAAEEARQLTLGEDGVFDSIAAVLDNARERNNGDTILIGGPPCQAYSLVGRARNRGKSDYVAENDGRHFLYREYVRILDRLRPAVFVMENVKGLLSSNVGGTAIFQRVIDDLGNAGDGYTLMPLSTPAGSTNRADDFLVRAELHGVPQARHRVFILGLRKDVALPTVSGALMPTSDPWTMTSVGAVLRGLPEVRSGLSRNDSASGWREAVLAEAERMVASPDMPQDLAGHVRWLMDSGLAVATERSGIRATSMSQDVSTALRDWLEDPHLTRTMQHETRGHIPEDLGRYLFAAVFAELRGRSPKLAEFPDFLQPLHKNRATGIFNDRFRVQLADQPSTTVTSHISKDGHYYIHPDPRQARALTVREAARLQTFPDNYVFCGPRTAQYHQVGNAVPPFLALQIARVVKRLVA